MRTEKRASGSYFCKVPENKSNIYILLTMVFFHILLTAWRIPCSPQFNAELNARTHFYLTQARNTQVIAPYYFISVWPYYCWPNYTLMLVRLISPKNSGNLQSSTKEGSLSMEEFPINNCTITVYDHCFSLRDVYNFTVSYYWPLFFNWITRVTIRAQMTLTSTAPREEKSWMTVKWRQLLRVCQIIISQFSLFIFLFPDNLPLIQYGMGKGENGEESVMYDTHTSNLSRWNLQVLSYCKPYFLHVFISWNSSDNCWSKIEENWNHFSWALFVIVSKSPIMLYMDKATHQIASSSFAVFWTWAAFLRGMARRLEHYGPKPDLYAATNPTPIEANWYTDC